MTQSELFSPARHSLSVNIPLDPVAQQRHRTRIVSPAGRKPFVQTYDQHDKDRQTYKSLILDQLPGLMPIPKRAPIQLEVYFFMPMATSASKKRKLAMLNNEAKHVQRPDIDNLLKFILDCCNGTVYHDDSQIWEVRRMAKLWGEGTSTLLHFQWEDPA